MMVYYKYGHSDVASFETVDALREFFLSEQCELDGNLDTPALIDAVIRRDAASDPSWRIVAVFHGALLCSGTNRGFA